MCICINCRHVHNCTTYKVIQEQHQQIVKEYLHTYFIPINTLIEVNIHQSIYNTRFEWDLTECLSFVEKPGNWLI